MIEYSIVVPVYRGEKTVEELFMQIKEVFSLLKKPFEVIFVYDCGPDNSWAKIENLKYKYPELIKGVYLSRNFGQHNAIICGFEHAEGRYFITMDEDLQHAPQDIPFMIEEQEKKDYDVVYGSYLVQSHSFFRNITSNVFRRVIEFGIPELYHDYSPFRLIKREVGLQIIPMKNSYTFLDGYISWVTSNISSCMVGHNHRVEGKSSYTISKLINHSINIFVTFSNLPVRFVTFSSMLIFLGSLSYAIYILVRKVFYNDLLPGFATVIILFGFGMGFMLLGLGIIGEYIYRINLKTTKRPNYLIRRIL